MATSSSAAAIGGGSRDPIYISSDEDDERAPLDDSYGEEDFQIQAALLLSLESSRAATAAASTSSARANVTTAPQTSPNRNSKGKRKLSSEDGSRKSKKKTTTSRREHDHFDCAICFDRVPVAEKFPVSRCAHAFCKTCVGQYVAAKVAENVTVISCPDPDCTEGAVEIDHCRGIIPSELFDRWSVALCEDAVGGDRFYCPFKDCSALLINDGAGAGAVEIIRESECPHCHRMFCASCRVPWHPGVKCEDFIKKLRADDKKGKDDDLTLSKLAKKKKWQRCPKCNMYVERIDGCVYIVCRCRHRFCYLCASPMTKGDHHCSRCKRTW